MDRRAFTLQLYAGKSPLPMLTSSLAQHASPTWRCSGCLMLWGVYGYTTDDARPSGAGCTLCDDTQSWIADSSMARLIDERVSVDSARFDSVHTAAFYTVAAMEQVIEQGQYNRLTHSCQRPLREKVSKAVTSTMESWIAQHGPGRELQLVQVAFYTPGPAVMTVIVEIGYPHGLKPTRFIVRYRWVM